jgi:hypothetical protein
LEVYENEGLNRAIAEIITANQAAIALSAVHLTCSSETEKLSNVS